MPDAAPPPLPPHPDDEATVRRERRVWPWIVGALVIFASFLMVQCHRCARQFGDGVTGALEELSKYNTEPGIRWREQPVHEADELLAAFLDDEQKTRNRLVGEEIVVRTTRWTAQRVDPTEEAADEHTTWTLRHTGARGTVEATIKAWQAPEAARGRFVQGLAHPERPQSAPLLIAGTVDWMNGDTIRLRSAFVLRPAPAGGK